MKKLIVCILSLTVLFCMVAQSCFAAKRVKIEVYGQKFTLDAGDILKSREYIYIIEEALTKRNLGSPILLGGSYRTVPHTADYESHHLISASSCRRHNLSVKNAPAVLLKKDLHKKTGSYGGGASAYAEREEQAFNVNGLVGVLQLGIDDLTAVLGTIGCKTPATPARNAAIQVLRYRNTPHTQEAVSKLSFDSPVSKTKKRLFSDAGGNLGSGSTLQKRVCLTEKTQDE